MTYFDYLILGPHGNVSFRRQVTQYEHSEENKPLFNFICYIHVLLVDLVRLTRNH